MERIKIGQLLSRIKESITLEDDVNYKRVTIRTKNQGISLRDVERGVNIGTKKQFLVRKGQFLLSKIDARNGAFGIVPEILDEAIITGNFWTFQVNKELLNIEWFNIFVSSSYFINICSKASSGTTNRQYLDEQKFLDFDIYLPNLHEQELFINRYKSINDKSEKVSKELMRQLECVQDLRESIIQEAIQGKLVAQRESDKSAGDLLEKIKQEKAQLIKEKKIKKEKPLPQITDENKPFDLPKGWEWVRLQDITHLITKGSSPKWQGVQYTENSDDILFITSENVGNFNLILDKKKYVEHKFNEIEPRSILQKGDLLMNIVGASIGRTAIFNIDACANINQAVCLIRLNPIIVKEYLLLFFNSKLCISYMYDNQVDSARANLSMSNIAKFLIPFPPLKEQLCIVEKVNQLMSLCDELELSIEQSKLESENLMKAVLQEAFKVKGEVLS